jgi:demethylmenaquinone methyltransferase / 2-methoxy-6-polyprenyl-1,4-benzoquinol methylase
MKEKEKVNSSLLVAPSRDGVASMFDQISSKYEIINTLLSCGIDHYWRRTLSRMIKSDPTAHLDLATGTGQVLIQIAKDHPTIKRSVGLDPSSEMLKAANRKAPHFTWVEAYAEKLPFEENSFNLATMSFGIRNTTNPSLALKEIKRTLQKGGQLLIMEFSLPRNILLKSPYLFYLRNILPLLGGLLSGKKPAYQYLSRTIQTFPQGDAFERLLKGAGFSAIKTRRLTFGVVSIYQAFKL